MPEEPQKDQYQQAFDQAKSRYRSVGVGGIEVPNPLGGSHTVLPKQDPTRHVIFDRKTGAVMIGSRAIRTKQQKDHGSIRIFDYGQPKEEDPSEKNK